MTTFWNCATSGDMDGVGGLGGGVDVVEDVVVVVELEFESLLLEEEEVETGVEVVGVGALS